MLQGSEVPVTLRIIGAATEADNRAEDVSGALL